MKRIVLGCDAEGVAHSVKPVHVSVPCTGRHPTNWRIRVVVQKARARDVRYLLRNAGAMSSNFGFDAGNAEQRNSVRMVGKEASNVQVYDA